MQHIHITALQLDLAWENPIQNCRNIEHMLASKTEDTDVIILPEMFTTGFTMNPKAFAETMDGDTYQWMHKLSWKHHALIIGSFIIKERDKYYNRLLAVSPKGLMAGYDKRHLFRMAGEDKHYSAGRIRTTLAYKEWKICPMICYDLRFPAWCRNRQIKDAGPDYDILIYVANWPEARSTHWETLLQARAIENQAYVIGVNRIGKDGNNVPYAGSSIIIDPQGRELAYGGEKEGILSAKLDRNKLDSYRNKFPAWQDADTFTIE